MKKIFEAHIQKLILKEDNFIYKTNLELLRLFYNFLYTKFNDEILCKLYLEQFTSISDITSSKIESNFYDVINDSNIKLFDIDDSELLNESGVYCIFNEIGNLMYVEPNTFGWDKLLEQAEEMYKQKIIDAWEDGHDSFSTRNAEQYYNETFGGKDEQ